MIKIQHSTVQYQGRTMYVIAAALLLLILFISLAFGAVPISFSELLQWLSGDASAQSTLILRELRLPRALLALLVGAMLGACGAATQGLFRNPLADPSLIGVSAGASAGASIVIVLGSSIQGSLMGLSLISIGAFVGAIVSVFFVYRISTGSNGTSVATMLLAGIAITFLAGSLTNVLEFLGDNDMLRRISLWRMGGLDGADDTRILIMAGVSIIVIRILSRYATALNALLLGESEARHLGVNINKLKVTVIVAVAAGVGTSVALAGTIIFIGLVVPHMVRMLTGPNHQTLIPLSAATGAITLIVADAFARTIIAPTELPVGLITTLIGAPVFIALLRKRHDYSLG